VTLTNKLAVGVGARLNINGKTVCFARAIPESTREIVTNQEETLCGDLDHLINRSQKGRKIVRWSFFFDLTWPVWEHIDGLLGLNNVSGDVYEMGQTDDVTAYPVVIDLDGEVHNIASAVTSGWSLRGQKGSRPVQMQMDIIGEDEASAGSFTADQLAIGSVYAFTDGDLTLSGDAAADVARPFDRFVLQVENGLVAEWNNSVTLTDVTIGNRQAVFATSVPYVNDHDDLFFDYRDNESGRKAVFVLSNTDKVLTFLIPTGLPVARPGSVLGKADQIRTPVTLLLHRSDSGGTRVAPLTITPSGP
jgi:hypothetical protein